MSNVLPLDNDMTKLDNNNQQYNFILEKSSEENQTIPIPNISPYYNLSNYIKIFIDDIKDTNIIISNYIDIETMNIIINFVNLYSNTEQYKINFATDNFTINIVKPVKDEVQLKQDIGNELFYFIKNIFASKKANKILNAAIYLDIPILIEIICAKIAVDVKYLSKRETEAYFQNSL
jgi:hypothetical protein